MRLELTARHLTITPAMRKLVERQLAPTLRMLNDNAVSAQVVLARERSRHHADVTLHARGEHFLHANGTGPDVAASLGIAIGKIDRQAQRVKGKWEARKRKRVPQEAGTSIAADETQVVRIIRARRYAVKPLSVDEAALEVGSTPDAFVVFRNTATDAVTVLFRRPDGHLGLIEPDA
ncbi:MAG TPA: ribosome-associated translation inhibitor RaiA [Vicinamibacterales bacterium]|nr:ribosome-associated translation inhibitor RaiA [Vicinamibacterales bacterium]